MTTRRFDPVFSAALRNELESLAEIQEQAPARGVLPALRRPQVWISIVTAVVLIAATIGVLQLTHGGESQPAGESRVVDPLASVTNPTSDDYVARSVRTLLTIRGTGPGGHEFAVPADVKSVRVYLDCAPRGRYATSIDALGESSGGCDRSISGFFDMPVTAGMHVLTVTLSKKTAYALLVMGSPAPTISAGALIDPLTQVRDLQNPDALVGDTRVLLRESALSGGAPPVAFQVPSGVGRLRAFLACKPSSATTELTIGGHVVSGCMNSIAHWFDFTPATRSVVAEVANPGGGAWSLLVVPAPKGAKDSPASTTLPYPTAPGTLLAKARGSGATASGTYRRPGLGIALTVTCRGTGWLEMSTDDGGTNTRGVACSTTRPQTVGLEGDRKDTALQRWSVVPHGDISWTFQLSTDS